MNLKGKRVLITGGSSGIGFATAQAMLAAGARVFITGRRPAMLAKAVDALRASRGDVDGAAADVASPAGRTTTLDAALAKLGGLDVLVNNAGGVRAGRIEDTSEAEIRAMIEVDLLAPIMLTRAALPHLRAGGDGLIVNVTAVVALIGLPFYTTYCAAKAGCSHFGEALRRELMGEGVRVITVYPSGTDTPMMKSNRGTAELGFAREPASNVADAILAGIRDGAIEVMLGDNGVRQIIAANRDNPGAVDDNFVSIKSALADAVRDHSAL
jgi:NAD(P)-dependent dehydrogenase (short-subunit alcohol dehydrogenase family)